MPPRKSEDFWELGHMGRYVSEERVDKGVAGRAHKDRLEKEKTCRLGESRADENQRRALHLR